MSSPTFNDLPIFDSRKVDATYYSEGVLTVHGYSKIIQTLHFNGENGNRLIHHGWPDRQWTFQGLMSYDHATPASALTGLKDSFRAIETYIDSEDYHKLVDSFGSVFTKARINTFDHTPIHKSAEGYIAQVTITGIIQGMVFDGETS